MEGINAAIVMLHTTKLLQSLSHPDTPGCIRPVPIRPAAPVPKTQLPLLKSENGIPSVPRWSQIQLYVRVVVGFVIAVNIHVSDVITVRRGCGCGGGVASASTTAFVAATVTFP